MLSAAYLKDMRSEMYSSYYMTSGLMNVVCEKFEVPPWHHPFTGYAIKPRTHCFLSLCRPGFAQMRANPSYRIAIPSSSVKHFASLARRLSRIFAHAYFHHREIFEQAEAENALYERYALTACPFSENHVLRTPTSPPLIDNYFSDGYQTGSSA